MSGVEHFAVEELNPYSFSDNQPSLVEAKQEYSELQAIFEQAGIEITHVGAPEGCQDGIYTANWALCLGRTALMSNLPNMRQAETPYATQQLKNLGYEIETLPHSIKFSGQGDALVCGNKIFAGYGYRTDLDAHEFIKKLTAKEVISLQTVPAMNESGQPIINDVTGWPDSFFYDIDLALAVINDNLVAWCPEAFTPASQELMKDVDVQTAFSELAAKYQKNGTQIDPDVLKSLADKFNVDIKDLAAPTVYSGKEQDLAKSISPSQ